MFNIVTKSLLGLGAVNAWSSKSQPGGAISITKNGANQAKDVFAPFIFNITKDLEIAEVDFDGGFLKDLIIHLPQPPLEDIGINFEHASNGVELFANGAEATISADFSYKYWITVTGEVAIKINKLSVDLECDINTQAVGAETAPLLKMQKTDIIVNPDDVDITLTGGLVSRIASIFIPFLKSTVVPDIISTVEDLVVTAVDVTANQYIVEYGTHVAIEQLGWVTADYSQMTPNAQITSDQMFEMAVNGTFFNTNHTVASQWPEPVKFPVRNSAGRSLQGHLSEWTVNTALEAAYSTSNTIDFSGLLRDVLGIQLNTTTFAIVLPEIVSKYGADKNVTLTGEFQQKQSYAHFTSGHAEGFGWAGISFSVEGQEAIYAEFDNASVKANLHSNSSGAIFGALNTLSCGQISSKNFRTTLGLSASQLTTQLQALITGVQEQANAGLAIGTSIPSLFGIKGEIEVNLHDGFVELGVDAARVTFESIKDKMIDLKESVRYDNKIKQMREINSQFA